MMKDEFGDGFATRKGRARKTQPVANTADADKTIKSGQIAWEGDVRAEFRDDNVLVASDGDAPVDGLLDEDASRREDGKKVAKTMKKDRAKQKKAGKWPKSRKILLTLLIAVVLAGIGVAIWILWPKGSHTNIVYTEPEPEPVRYYSVLTGEEIASEELNSLPTFCVQIPNGVDINPRVQIGLQYAGVIFEAIAEGGITRFAAVFQNADTAMIGPVRSLRTYYLDWDTPFDCTVVHAGGADDALAALKSGGYRDLTESKTYMWRDYSMYIAPNNLYTSSSLLNAFNEASGFTESHPTGFTRLTPVEAEEKAAENLRLATEGEEVETTTATGETATETKKTPLVEKIQLNFGSNNNYNVVYTYNSETNSYDRAYANGNAHSSYDCGTAETTPANCAKEQLSPSVVIALIVQETRASDGKHEAIGSLGSGTAHIFQNGEAIVATWRKDAAADQIKFYDDAGAEIKLSVGQTWISAVPCRLTETWCIKSSFSY